MFRLSVIIPMYNEALRIESGVGVILQHLSRTYNDTVEVILVDDGSRDNTPARARELLDRFPTLTTHLLIFEKNRGKGAAVRAGMMKAEGKVRAFVDADNATPIEEIDRLLPLAEERDTIVIGSRALDPTKLEKRQPFWRQFMGKTFNRIIRLIVGLPFYDTQCGFKLFGPDTAPYCFSRQTLERFAFDVELLWIAKRAGFKIAETPVRWRHVPESRVHPIRDSFCMACDAIRIRFRHNG